MGHWVGGKDIASYDRVGPVFDPATGTQTAEVALASVAEVDVAVATAAEAYEEWRHSTLATRTAVMFAFHRLLDENRTAIARAITSEHGKVLTDAAGEVARGLECVEFACGIAQLLRGGHSVQVSTGVDVYELRQPLGVVAGITPFNFPAMVPLWMIPNAIACGNAFVLKPSEKDPSASLLIADLLGRAGLPDGVFNVVQGDAEAVGRLLEHPDVAAISFVGSTPIARSVYERATVAGKRVQALGGAKNHMVVLPDADLDTAADAAVSAAYGSAGERCMAVSVAVTVGDIAEDFVAAVRDRIGRLQVGPGTEPESQMGPLVTAAHRDRVASYLDVAAEEGASVVVDGRTDPVAERGFFLGASLVDDVRPTMRVYADEIFGPVLSVVRADSVAEAIGIVNANPYGNGVAIFTRDGGAAREFQQEVTVGMVGVNVPIPVPVSSYSFGGWKASLFGDTHIYGADGVRFYTRTKVVTERWPDPATSTIDLGFPTHH
ncbi:MAG TPA: CoA-acylating methylmalonate-semialdehyde dehydrogenase [Nocardioidaceae bacterium]|nr:CoA-acylating methylmalonate-semialdehyde dehydrogenase [Nocardioidaceae bacterium]